MQLTWYGHSTWHVTVGGTELLIDPFFDNPKTESGPSDLDAPDYVLLTHGHADHIADAEAFPDATVVATPELTAFVQSEFGLENALPGGGMNVGGTVECGDAYVTMHRADHTNGAMTEYGVDVGVPAGFIVSDTAPSIRDGDSTTFYHTGDTGLMTEMRDVIGSYLQPDAVAVPIGDHFTMGPWQAAIAVDWLGVEHAFPQHYDTFGPIEVDPARFTREVEEIGSDAEVHVLEADEPFVLE